MSQGAKGFDLDVWDSQTFKLKALYFYILRLDAKSFDLHVFDVTKPPNRRF